MNLLAVVSPLYIYHMHPCIFLSTVDVSLGRTAYFIFCLSARTLLGSVAEVYPPPVCFLPRMELSSSAHYYLFYKLYLNTLDICLCWILSHVQSGQSLEGSAPFLGFLFFLKFSDVFGEGSEGQWIFPISPARSGYSVPSDIFGGIRSCRRVFNSLTARLAAFFLSYLACPSVPCEERSSKYFSGTTLLHPVESYPCLICLIMEEVLTGCLITPKVPNFLRGSLKFLEELLSNCERRPGKSTRFLLLSSSYDKEGINGLFPFNPTGFLV